VASDDFDEPLLSVALYGDGSLSDTPPSQQVQDLLAFFDASVTAGTLSGDGPGKSAEGRLGALRNMIVAVGDLISSGEIADACRQIQDVLDRCDGAPQPPDFVTGPSAAEVYERVLRLRQTIGCAAG
jgi:hypothetical protein